MRFLKPTKLGESSESSLRHELRWIEWVAKTWRYFVSFLRLVEPLLLLLLLSLPLASGALFFLRWRADFGGISIAVAIGELVSVDVDVGAMIAVV
jgi:hypothetical protein